MARAGRQKSASGVYHVLLRGVEGLFSDSSDYVEFRARLAEYFADEVRLLAFLLLPNRVHLIIDEGGAELSLAVKPLCTSYARYYNRTHSIDGKLFYDRYKSVPLESRDDIADAVAFLNAVGRRFAGKETSSLAEYLGEAVLCDTKRLAQLIGDKTSSMKPKALHLDDYSQLTREEMEEYLRIVADCTLDDLAEADRQSESFKMIFSCGVTARAVLPLFGVHTPAAEKKKAVVQKPAAVEEKNEPAPKKNLSVWLL
ncbi:MAG: hypothetical protein IJ366_08745 [Clostridia bacterium]|nr:hypothetical protein [Clostridia bacterium]